MCSEIFIRNPDKKVVFFYYFHRRSYQFQFSPNFHRTSFSRTDPPPPPVCSKSSTSPILEKLFRVRISLRLTVHATVVFKESNFLVILAFWSFPKNSYRWSNSSRPILLSGISRLWRAYLLLGPRCYFPRAPKVRPVRRCDIADS